LAFGSFSGEISETPNYRFFISS